MFTDPMFRFLSVRPSDTQVSVEQAPAKVDLYTGVREETPLHAELSRVRDAQDHAQTVRIVEEYVQSGRLVGTLDQLAFDPRPGLAWTQANRTVLPADAAFPAAMTEAYGKSLADLVADGTFTDSLARLADTLLAETVVPTHPQPQLDRLTVAHKFLILLAQQVAGTLPPAWTVGDLVGRRTLLIPAVGTTRVATTSSDQPPAPAPAPDPAPEAEDDSTAKLRAAQAAYEHAHREMAGLAQDAASIVLRPVLTEQGQREAELETGLSAQRLELARQVAGAAVRPEAGAAGAATMPLRNGVRPTLNDQAVAGLSDVTRGVLENLRIDAAAVRPANAVGLIERAMNDTSGQLATGVPSGAMISFAGAILDRRRLEASLGISGAGGPPALPSSFCSLQAGIGDLLIVRQQLKAYELGEFAHVENVLAGETRDREHRRLDTSEDITTTEQTTDTQRETDLQSTQRNEMQTEADKTVKQQFGLEAGLQISGSYGPTVQFAAHLNANYSTSSEETQRKAISFSQEITQKTSESVRQTIKQSVTHRVLQEIQEINKHSFVNTSPTKHIRGVYRWLNKVYDAQIFNYGQRMMYEFVVPEPAAYYLYAMVENPPQDLDLVKPDPPTYLGQPLKPAHLTRTSFYDLVAKYNVTGVPAPPPEFQTAAYFDKQDGGDENTYARSGKIDLPDGYEAYAAVVMTDYSWIDGHNHDYRVMLGNRGIDASNAWGCFYQDIDSRERELAVAYEAFQVTSFTLGIDVECRLTTEAFAKWQQSVYDSIIATYLKLKADYEEKIAAKQVGGPADFGTNPLANQQITRDELRKLVLMILTGSDNVSRDSFLASAEPFMDLTQVCPNGSWIRFFENAFEWTNMTYVLYPYFWGRHARWNSAIHFTDPDPDFAAFLKAGAARVQVPVRPGFERALAYFCQYGAIWNGNDAPLRDDDLYVPIVDEIAANLGKYDNDGVPYPDGSTPWEVRVPTELVLLENLDEVPNVRDILTGNNVTLEA